MTTSSTTFKILWTYLLLMPLLGLIISRGQSRAGSADEGMEVSFELAVLLTLGMVLALWVFFSILASSVMSGTELKVALLTCLLVVPLYLLVSGSSDHFGYPGRGRPALVSVLLLVLHALWIAALLKLNAWLKRLRAAATGSPEGVPAPGAGQQ